MMTNDNASAPKNDGEPRDMIACEVTPLAEGIGAFLLGKSKLDTLTICLSIAATTGFLLGVSKLDLQKMLIRYYDKRQTESSKWEVPNAKR